MSLAYVYGKMSIDAMQEIEKELFSALRLHCRHVGILHYLAQSETALWVRFQETAPQQFPRQESGVLQLMHEQFWGMAQSENGRLQLQAIEWLTFLQKVHFVEQVGEDDYTNERCFRITGKGRAALEQAVRLMGETERRIFSQLPSELSTRVCGE